MGEAAVRIFGDSDRNERGKIISTSPAWGHTNQVEDLQEGIASKERAIENGWVPSDSVAQMKMSIRAEKQVLDRVTKDDPRGGLSEKERDALASFRKWLGKEIASLLFSRSDMMTGQADAHEEARRISQPCINVPDEVNAAQLKECGVDNFWSKGMITRGDAERAYSAVSRALGEPASIELLRKK